MNSSDDCDLREKLAEAERSNARLRDDYHRLAEAWKAATTRAETSSVPGQYASAEPHNPVVDYPHPREWELEDQELRRERDEACCDHRLAYEALQDAWEHMKRVTTPETATIRTIGDFQQQVHDVVQLAIGTKNAECERDEARKRIATALRQLSVQNQSTSGLSDAVILRNVERILLGE